MEHCCQAQLGTLTQSVQLVTCDMKLMAEERPSQPCDLLVSVTGYAPSSAAASCLCDVLVCSALRPKRIPDMISYCGHGIRNGGKRYWVANVFLWTRRVESPVDWYGRRRGLFSGGFSFGSSQLL